MAMGSSAFKVLVSVADSFEKQAAPLEAIKCLQALTQSVSFELPHFEAEVRLKLAQLQFRHTHNVKDAIHNLERALLVVRRLKTHTALKCDIYATLAKCHFVETDTKTLKSVCNGGLKASQQVTQHDNRAELEAWELHFHGLLIRAAQCSGDPAEVEAALNKAIARAKALEDLEALGIFQTGLAQHYAEERLREEWQKALSEAQATLSIGSLQDKLSVQCARLHLEILQVIWHMTYGTMAELQKPAPDSKEPAIVMRIQSLRQSIQECPDQDLRYAWLPRHCLLALACIACSVSLRPNGKVNKARQCLEAAARHMADGSADDDDEIGGTEGDERPESRQAALIKALILEEMIGIALTRNDLPAAADLIAQLMQLCSSKKCLQKSEQCALHMMAGYYCRGVRAPEASQHFLKAAEASDHPLDIQMAITEAVLAGLDPMADTTVDNAVIQWSVDLLQKNNIYTVSELANEGPREGCLSLYATGKALLAQGNLALGTPILLKSLKKGHSQMQHHQLVSKIMGTLAPMHAGSDLITMGTMAQTGFMLSHAQGDLITQVKCLQAKLQHKRLLGESEVAEEHQDYLNKKQESIEDFVQTAMQNSDLHELIVRWNL